MPHLLLSSFAGIEDVLELVDLEGNRLNNVSWAFADLKNLRYLYLANNNISTLPPEVMTKFCPSLRALSVSGNNFDQFPRFGLTSCKKLSHLNIGYNRIEEIGSQDFGEWSHNLDTLILRNNRLTNLGPRVFKGKHFWKLNRSMSES